MPSYVNTNIKKAASCNFLINLHENEYNYLKGNVIRGSLTFSWHCGFVIFFLIVHCVIYFIFSGKVTYPFAAALVAAWDTLAMTVGSFKKELSVRFSEVHLYSQPMLHDQKQLRLNISLHRGKGRFDVSNSFLSIDRLLHYLYK